MTNAANFIPIDLRNALAADAERADQKNDRRCADILRQLAAYTGDNAPQHARDLEAERCTIRYTSAKELMRLVVFAEQEAERRRAKP